jgi:AcrR family transcriptional regulator
VAADVGISTRAVYSLFGSKEGLVAAPAVRAFDVLGAAVARLPRTDDPTADLVRAGLAAGPQHGGIGLPARRLRALASKGLLVGRYGDRRKRVRQAAVPNPASVTRPVMTAASCPPWRCIHDDDRGWQLISGICGTGP